MFAGSRKQTTQTVMVVTAVIILMLIGLCTEHAAATNNAKNKRIKNTRTTTTTTSTIATTFVSYRTSPEGLPAAWLNLLKYYSVPLPPATQVCGSTALSKAQQRYCSRHPEMAASFVVAARNAVQQCQIQFKHSRWNCTVTDPISLFGNLLYFNTPEKGFIYAIASASLTYSITKLCGSGTTSACMCDYTTHTESGSLTSTPVLVDNSTVAQANFVHRGCSDNVKDAMVIAQKFLDDGELTTRTEMTHQARAAMNLHNNKIGRMIIEANRKTDCRCVGISGSCTSKTCLKLLPKFDEIGALLKAKFRNSVKVNKKRIVNLTASKTRGQRQAVGKQKFVATSLVHLQNSHDFCDFNYKIGSLGTQGRLCNITSNGEDSCESLCCGRGYYTHQFIKIVDCECNFIFCCRIECKKCEVQITEHRCI